MAYLQSHMLRPAQLYIFFRCPGNKKYVGLKAGFKPSHRQTPCSLESDSLPYHETLQSTGKTAA